MFAQIKLKMSVIEEPSLPEIDIANFKKLYFHENKWFLTNDDQLLFIPIDPYDDKQMKIFNILPCHIKYMKAQIDNPPVPIGYEKKFCIMFMGKVLDSCDTKAEFEKSLEEWDKKHILYTKYIPKY